MLSFIPALAVALVAVTPMATETATHVAALVARAEKGGLELFVEGTGSCPAEAKHCVGIALHVVEVGDTPVQTPTWVYHHVAHANKLFAKISVGFEVVSIDALPAKKAKMETRTDRDHLGRKIFGRSVVHVFVVSRLADVDIEGEEIRGVHWRDRADTSRRWIILSAIGSPLVLAHEMGHFFGLPHSRYDISIMNKTPRPTPTWPDRVFAKPELRKMERHRDEMLSDGMLVPRRKKRRRR